MPALAGISFTVIRQERRDRSLNSSLTRGGHASELLVFHTRYFRKNVEVNKRLIGRQMPSIAEIGDITNMTESTEIATEKHHKKNKVRCCGCDHLLMFV